MSSLRWLFLGATLLSVSLLAAMILAVTRPVTRRLKLLGLAADAISQGDLAVRATADGADELSTLADRFNHMTDELVASNRSLELKNEQLEEFVYVSSHDLKSPLRTISSFAQMLEIEQGQLLDAGGRENLDYIKSAAARMHLLIEDLQTYLRIDQEGATERVVETVKILQELVAFHGPSLEEAGATVDIDDRLPAVVANTTHVRQVFDNLITNSVRYRHPSRPVVIHIHHEKSDDQILIHVDDNGIGIPPQHRSRVLGVFERLDHNSEGTGMGLAICARIARSYNGSLVLDESPLGGTRATLSMPSSRAG